MTLRDFPSKSELIELWDFLTPQERAEMDALLMADDEPTIDPADEEVAWLPDDPVRWIETEFYIPETKAAIKLEPYQRAVLREALRRDADGKFVYSLVLWSDLKKSAKSTIAGAVVLFLAWHTEWESARVVGNDLKQANSRTFYYIERAIKLNPRLKARCQSKSYKISLPNNTTIEAIAVDPKGEAGGGDLIVCFTELWAAKNDAAQQLWTETTLSPLKYGQSMRWCESYAGYEGESPILEQLYESGVRNGRRVDVGIDGLELFADDNARMLCLWNTVPRCEWQTPEYYSQEAAALRPSEYARVHENKWATSTSPFLENMAWWDACQGELPALRPFQPVVVALDAAVTNDCFGIVVMSRTLTADRDLTYVREVQKWTPPKGGKIAFSNLRDKEDMTTPEGYCRWLKRTYNVIEWAYDPYQLEDFAQRLASDGLGFFNPFNQGMDRAIADKQLYDSILHCTLVHDGNADLREHVQNANRKPEEEKLLRIIKRAPRLKIDLTVAASMANHRARFLNIG